MKTLTDEEIAVRLLGTITDGFNRSLNALRDAGAVNTSKMDKDYCGVGSKFYELVTEQMLRTARLAAPGIRQIFSDDEALPPPAAELEKPTNPAKSMTAKMKCSNCGAEMSNLNLSWGKKQLWFIIPIMLLGFLPMMKIFWFKGEATKDLVISEVQKRTNGDALEIVGLLTNSGKHTFSSVTIEAEFFDAAGNFLDEGSEYLRSDVAGGAKEHFKITIKTPPAQATSPETKMVVKIVGGRSMPF